MPVSQELLSRLQGLSKERYISNELRHFFCNERGLNAVLPTIVAKRAQAKGGIGLVVGTGGIFSLLPSLDLEGVIMIDKNPSVLRFSKFLADAVMQAQTPLEVEEAVTSFTETDYFTQWMQNRTFSISTRNVSSRRHFATYLEGTLASEKRYFEDAHWSNPDRFRQAQEALLRTPIIFINVDLNDPTFTGSIADILGTYNSPLSYLNLTNAHAYPWRVSLEALDLLPITDQTTIQYSDFYDPTGKTIEQLYMMVAPSLGEYKKVVKRRN